MSEAEEKLTPPAELQLRVPAALSTYIRIARPDHWIKNVFMIPGAGFALAAVPTAEHSNFLVSFALAALSLCLIASANYTINEYLDSQYDRFHPLKSRRPGAQGLLDPRFVSVQYIALAATGLAIGFGINLLFASACIALLVMGIAYNIPPLRLKDRVYVDVISESVNNPIRFLLGWFAVTGDMLPPSSGLLAYWTGGAFLMATKRYSEFRRISDPERAALYRRSFAKYSEQSLLMSAFFYALSSAFFIGVFLIKYRIELVLTFPLFAVLFTWYLAIALKPDSAAQAPEKLYKESAFMGFAVFTFVVAVSLFFIDLPFLQGIQSPSIIRLRF
jgi:decaprenyl-phosphate phosphoribosyltransferase